MERAEKSSQPIDSRTEVSLQEKAFLVHGSRKVPVHTAYASKFSLFFRYAEDQQLIDTNEPVNLLIRNNGQSIEIGPCRVLSCTTPNGYAGRLVFINQIYDTRRLLYDKKAVMLQSAFQDLPQILAHKEKIQPAFKNYVADLSYDLQVYKSNFDQLDAQYREEPQEVQSIIQQAIISTQGTDFIQYLDDKLRELEQLVADFSQEEHQRHGFYFRKQLWNFLLCCPLMARTNLRPRGYAGDSVMMHMIYTRDYQGESSFARLLHKHAVETPAAQSVRNRINLIAKMLSKASGSRIRPASGRIKTLSVGCGPALEIADILKSAEDCEKYHFVFLDQDPLALREAADSVHKVENKLNCKIKADYIKGSVRTMLSPRKLKKQWGKFDFIYSLGLFDYLNAPVARAVLGALYDLLSTGAEMVIGNFHVSNRSRYHMEYWGDWKLIHRSEEDFKNLIQNLATQSNIIFENTGNQMFLHLKNLPPLPRSPSGG